MMYHLLGLRFVQQHRALTVLFEAAKFKSVNSYKALKWLNSGNKISQIKNED
jgi:hypothetical protein